MNSVSIDFTKMEITFTGYIGATEAMADQTAEADVYMPMPLGPAMKNDIADVVDFVRLSEGWREDFIKVDNRIDRLEVSFADPNFFSMFSFHLKRGNAATVLKDLKKPCAH